MHFVWHTSTLNITTEGRLFCRPNLLTSIQHADGKLVTSADIQHGANNESTKQLTARSSLQTIAPSSTMSALCRSHFSSYLLLLSESPSSIWETRTSTKTDVLRLAATWTNYEQLSDKHMYIAFSSFRQYGREQRVSTRW